MDYFCLSDFNLTYLVHKSETKTPDLQKGLYSGYVIRNDFFLLKSSLPSAKGLIIYRLAFKVQKRTTSNNAALPGNR
jgi:hypothetical protein